MKGIPKEIWHNICGYLDHSSIVQLLKSVDMSEGTPCSGQADNQLDSHSSCSYQADVVASSDHAAGAAASHSYGVLQGPSSSQHDPNSNFYQYPSSRCSSLF